MTTRDIRYRNALALRNSLREAPGENGSGRFAERLGMSRQQAAHIVGDRPSKPIGDRIARRIEAAFGKPEGWLDIPQQFASTENSRIAGALIVRPPTDWMARQLGILSLDAIVVCIHTGDAMVPTITEGALLFVDSKPSWTDGVYVVEQDGHQYVRRAQRQLDGSIVLSPDNPRYDRMVIKPDTHDITVIGRVLRAFNAASV